MKTRIIYRPWCIFPWAVQASTWWIFWVRMDAFKTQEEAETLAKEVLRSGVVKTFERVDGDDILEITMPGKKWAIRPEEKVNG